MPAVLKYLLSEKSYARKSKMAATTNIRNSSMVLLRLYLPQLKQKLINSSCICHADVKLGNRKTLSSKEN